MVKDNFIFAYTKRKVKRTTSAPNVRETERKKQNDPFSHQVWFSSERKECLEKRNTPPLQQGQPGKGKGKVEGGKILTIFVCFFPFLVTASFIKDCSAPGMIVKWKACFLLKKKNKHVCKQILRCNFHVVLILPEPTSVCQVGLVGCIFISARR